MKPGFSLLPCLVLALAIAGCGGAMGTGDGNRGEGNIPVGKIVDPDPAPARVLVHTATRRRIEAYTDPSGYVFLPQLPPGPTSIIVTPLDLSKQETIFGFVAGNHQSGVFHISLLDLNVNVSADDFSVNFRDRTVLAVGEKRPIEFRLNGPISGTVLPSYWVSGGVASIRDGLLIAREPGEGKLTIAVGEAQKTMHFTVVAVGK